MLLCFDLQGHRICFVQHDKTTVTNSIPTHWDTQNDTHTWTTVLAAPQALVLERMWLFLCHYSLVWLFFDNLTLGSYLTYEWTKTKLSFSWVSTALIMLLVCLPHSAARIQFQACVPESRLAICSTHWKKQVEVWQFPFKKNKELLFFLNIWRVHE